MGTSRPSPTGWQPVRQNKPKFNQENFMQTRRETLKHSAAVAGLLASTGLFPQYAQAFEKVAFDAKTIAEAVKAMGGAAPVESKDVTITGPDIAENGAVVPLGVSTSMANVKRVLLLVEKNPSALVAMFNTSPEIENSFSTRSKMGQSSDVYAVAITNDGKTFFAKKEVKVTLGGCGG
jgi:sulfur-oxidizing protein SoxY